MPFKDAMLRKLCYVWGGMIARCHNPKDTRFHRYGARGIRVCQEWQSFATFKAWALSNGYAEGLTIDRVNPEGDYKPENCRVATRQQQNQNRRPNRHGKTSRFKGVNLHQGRWMVRVRDKYHGSFDDEIEAARRYDEVASHLYGEFAMLNFPEGKVSRNADDVAAD